MSRYVPRKPCLILLMGVAGSGKTTLARGILRHICAVYLDNNQVADAFFPKTRSSRRYEAIRPGIYRALYAITRENLELGNSVLLDVPHMKEVQTPAWRLYIKRLARSRNGTLVVIRCTCTEKTLRTRLTRRGKTRDRWKLAHWREFLAAQPIDIPIPFPHLDIDTENDVTGSITAAVQYIRRQTRSPILVSGVRKPLFPSTAVSVRGSEQC